MIKKQKKKKRIAVIFRIKNKYLYKRNQLLQLFSLWPHDSTKLSGGFV